MVHDEAEPSTPADAASPRGDGKAPPEAGPAEESLAILQLLRDARPDLGADLDQVIATIEHLQLEVSGLRHALTGRATIDAAKGILIAERGCDEQAAFRLLKQFSQDTNVPLRDVARAIVYAAQNPDRRTPGPTTGPTSRSTTPPPALAGGSAP